MARYPIQGLAKFASRLAQPEMKRRSYWRALAGGDHWALILITHGRPGEPPERPEFGPSPRISPEWLRRTGEGLGPVELVHERIRQRLRAETQDQGEVDVGRATAIATDAVVSVLAELGVDVAALKTGEEQ